MAFTNVQLFGGAITALVPSTFADVSTIRQVPDNQEVYLETDGFTSLTFDITERVTHLPSNKEALAYHLDNIVADEDSKEVLSLDENLNLPHLPSQTPVLALIANVTPPPNPNPRPLTPTYTTIFLTLIRLVDQSTDVLISLNLPTIPDTAVAQTQGVTDLSTQTLETVSKIVNSFEVKNWNLFDGE